MLQQTYSFGATPDHAVLEAVTELCYGEYVAAFNAADTALVRRVSLQTAAIADQSSELDEAGRLIVRFGSQQLLALVKDLHRESLAHLQQFGAFGPATALRADLLSTLGLEEI